MPDNPKTIVFGMEGNTCLSITVAKSRPAENRNGEDQLITMSTWVTVLLPVLFLQIHRR